MIQFASSLSYIRLKATYLLCGSVTVLMIFFYPDADMGERMALDATEYRQAQYYTEKHEKLIGVSVCDNETPDYAW